MQIAKPSEALQPYIKEYWCIDNALKEENTNIYRVIPCGLPELTLYLGSKPVRVGSPNAIEDDLILCGQKSRFYDLKIDEELSIFSVVFKPHGFMSLFDFPLSEIHEQSVPFYIINSKLEREIHQQLVEVNTFKGRIDIVEKYFFELLKKEFNKYDFSRIGQTIKMINSSNGKLSIDALASAACLSRKQFERKFTELIGISPKQYLKIVRFQYSIYLKSKSRFNITELALESGYYDQSHFINDFKKFTGYTPKEYYNSFITYSDLFEC